MSAPVKGTTSALRGVRVRGIGERREPGRWRRWRETGEARGGGWRLWGAAAARWLSGEE